MTEISYSDSSLDSFTRRLRYLADDSKVLEGYVRDNTNFRSAGANFLFEIFAVNAESVSSKYTTAAGSLNHILDSMASSAQQTIDTYRSTDESRRASFSEVSPSAGSGEVGWSAGGVSPDLDQYQPSTALEPPEAVPVRDLGDLVHQISGWMGVSSIINGLIHQIWGVNLFDEVAQKVVGDWERVYSSADAFRNVANYHDQLAACAETARNSVEWQGEAADSAYETCAQLIERLRQHVGPLEDVALAYSLAGHAAEGGAQIIGSLLGKVVDRLLAAALAAAAGALTAYTGIGFAIGESAALVQIGQALQIAGQVGTLLDDLALRMDIKNSPGELMAATDLLITTMPDGNGSDFYG